MTFQAAVVQLEPGGEQPEQSRATVISLTAGLNDADLIVLPELWPTGYHAFDAYQRSAEPLDGPTVAALRTIAIENQAHVVGGSFIEQSGSELHNTSILLDPAGEMLQVYRKAHLMSYRSAEQHLLRPGRRAVVVDTALGRIGLAICYDIRFPELFRAMVDAGAEIFVVPAAWPAERVGAWELFLRARAAENQAFVLGCNGAGNDHGVQLAGRSLVIAPSGEIQAEAGSEPTIVRTRVDLSAVRDLRQHFPVLQHRNRWLNGEPAMVLG